MSIDKLDYKSIDWKSVVKYSRNSPSSLIWVDDIGKMKIGDIAGSKSFSDKEKTKPKCWDLRYKNRLWKIHRIIWILFYDDLENNLVINHIDCNPFNNNIDNLELVGQNKNSRRQKCHKGLLRDENLTGHTGVSEFRREGVLSGYTASCRDLNGKTISYTFSINRYGDALAQHLAKECRNKIIEILNLGDAGYAE